MTAISSGIRALLFGTTMATSSLSLAVPSEGHEIMVAGPSPYAVEVAREVRMKGGNAVDVAVACVLSMAVTHPYYAAFGGGGFALVLSAKDKKSQEVKALDFREMAPGKLHPGFYKDKPDRAALDGGLAVGVPGNPAGLWELHRRYGKLKWHSLFERAIQQASEGFRVSGEWASTTSENKQRFNLAGKRYLFKKNGNALKPGEILKQPQLARFLKAYQKQGARAFYQGIYADDLVKAVAANQGVISNNDLKNYKVRWLEPLATEYEGHKVYLMPPPSSGGIIIAQALKLFEKKDLKSLPPLSTAEFHMISEIGKLSFRGRSLLGDPDFDKNPLLELLSDSYLNGLAARIKPDQALEVEPLREISFEKENTTHLSVIDAEGNAVALTLTLNGDYGSGLLTTQSGIALNNEMDDFTTRPGKPNMFGLIQGETNAVRAGARPLSSMSPTIVTKNGRVYLALGAPGGPRIISAVLQVLHRLLTQPMGLEQAVRAPRVHHQFLPNVVITDPFRLSPEIVEGLQSRGHQVKTGPTGKVYVVRVDDTGVLSGAFDDRGEGATGGF